MNEVRIAFGVRSQLVQDCLNLLGWESYIAISNSMQSIDFIGTERESLKIIDFERLLTDVMQPDVRRLTIIFSGPFSRAYNVDLINAYESILSLHKTLIYIIKSRPSIEIDLTVIGSAEVAVFGIKDSYRLLKKAEFNLFCMLASSDQIRIAFRYFAVPTIRPGRLMGRMLKVERQCVVRRLVDAINLNRLGVGLFNDLRYFMLNLIIKKMFVGTIKNFGW